MRRVVFLYVFLALAAVTMSAQTDVPAVSATPQSDSTVQDVYLAKDNGNGKAGDVVSSFTTNDIPIHCVVQLTSTKPATVKMSFIAVSVSGVKPDSKVVSVSYSTTDGQSRVYFTGKPGGKWSPGKYRVDIYVDGKLARDLVFEIRLPESGVGKAAYFQQKGITRGKLTARTKKPEN